MREVPSRNTHCAFGVARRNVTAPVGIYSRYWGAADHDVADGVHRPATATAAAIAPIGDRDPSNSLVLVALDYGSFHPLTDEKRIRNAVRERNGLTEANLLINLSHCHAGANASSQRTDLPGGELIPDYLQFLAEKINEAVADALANLQTAWITWGYGRCSMAGNRDFWDAEAGAFGCGFNPGAESDDTVLVGRVTSESGSVRAILFNYACHPTTLAWDNHLLSPDYIGAAREVLEQAFEAPAMFFQGASGDLGPRVGYVGDPAVADRNGRQLGYAAAEAVEALPPAASVFSFTGIVKSGADIATWSYEPLAVPDLEPSGAIESSIQHVELDCKYFPSAQEIRADLERTTDRAIGERLKRRLMVREDLGEGDVYSMPIWVWRLGEAAVVAIPNEPYSILQQSLREAFADVPVMVMGVTNGTLGYLCPAELYGTGRYQEKQSPFLPGCLEKTIAAAAGALAGSFRPESTAP